MDDDDELSIAAYSKHQIRVWESPQYNGYVNTLQFGVQWFAE